MSSPPLFRLREVQKSYGSSFTLLVECLDIFAGESFCLLGPTGAGKTTLLRLLAGLEWASGKQIGFGPYRLSPAGLPLAARRCIAMVHQRPLLLTGTVRFNVEYGLRLRGVKQRQRRVNAILKRLKLTGLARQSARTLSGGQTQLVALARALVLEPEVLLLDEPTANLDPAHVAMVEQAVAEVRQRRAMTVVWATHNQFQARRVAGRVGLLLDGRLVETAATEKFFRSPDDPRTAAFVQGKMVY